MLKFVLKLGKDVKLYGIPKTPISAETEQNLARNSLGSIKTLGAKTRSLARTSAQSQL